MEARLESVTSAQQTNQGFLWRPVKRLCCHNLTPSFGLLHPLISSPAAR